MNCKEIQDELLLNGLREEMQSHLANCGECKEFSKIVINMNDLNQLSGPSLALDNKILDYAKNNRPQRKQPIPFYIFTAVAAILVIGFTVLLTKNTSNSVETDPSIVQAESPEKNEDLAENTVEESELDEALDSLWDDDIMNADITAIEGELFVLSAELYSN